MSNSKKLLKISEELLREEIAKTGLPPIENHKICLIYGKRLAKVYKIDEDFILACLNFMDVKIGEAYSSNRLGEHIQMSVKATLKVIEPLALDEKTTQKITGCVLNHHGVDKYPSIEAEICANADCFKFLHPRGVFAFIASLGKRGMEFDKVLACAKQKLDEKMAVISLPEVRRDAQTFYQSFSKLLEKAKGFNKKR